MLETVSIMERARSLFSESMSYGEGLFVNDRIFSSWCKVDEPTSHDGATWEDGLAYHDLGEDTAEAPHVYTLAVLVSTQQNFWRSVPPRSDVLCQHRTVLVLLGYAPHQPEVTQPNEALAIEQHVAGLHVAVDHLAAVQVTQRQSNLIHDVLLVYVLQDVFAELVAGYRMTLCKSASMNSNTR